MTNKDDDLIIEALDENPVENEEVKKAKLDATLKTLFDSLNLPKDMEDLL